MTSTRPWSAWVLRGSILMAGLAALALAATVFFAQRALTDASDVIVRGEGDALVSAVISDVAQDGSPVTTSVLEQELSAHAGEGLRYLAVVDRDYNALAEAGQPTMDDVRLRPGEAKISGKRARVANVLMGPRRGRPPGGGPRVGPPGMALLVVEFEPPTVEKLRGDLTRISVVAAIAGGVLLAFAIAWSRSANRLAAVEERAAREQRLVALGSMSSVMAHELRNPLTSLKGHAQLLVEDLEGLEKPRKKAERVVADAERLEQLTTSLLDFVRDGPMELTSITPAELVAQSLEHLASSRVKVELANAPREVTIDPLRLARAVHNVVDNALQATDTGESVELRVESIGNDTLVSVIDHGPGLPPGSETHIFEPFITTRVKGTGLGLAVARRIAEQHGGTLIGKNHPGGGALFELRIPTKSEKNA